MIRKKYRKIKTIQYSMIWSKFLDEYKGVFVINIKEASPSCIEHRQMIEIFRGTEIENLQLRRKYQCQKCFKGGYSSDHSIQCHFCTSDNVRLI